MLVDPYDHSSVFVDPHDHSCVCLWNPTIIAVCVSGSTSTVIVGARHVSDLTQSYHYGKSGHTKRKLHGAACNDGLEDTLL